MAAKLKAEMAVQVATFPEKYGRVPHLVVILVGNDPGSQTYVRNKEKACDVVGFKHTTFRMPEETSEKLLTFVRFAAPGVSTHDDCGVAIRTVEAMLREYRRL